MTPRKPCAAFTVQSGFMPGRSAPFTKAVSPWFPAVPKMVTPKHVRRSEEIKRLTKQLEELRKARERVADDAPPAAPSELEPPAPPSAPSFASAEQPAAAPPRAALRVGKHAENSRFLSLSQVNGDEYCPRILTVAGSVPGLTVKQFEDTPPVLQNRPPEAGSLFLTMVPEGYKGQIIAFPGYELVAACRDPVAVLIDPAEISAVKMPIDEGDEVVLLVERNLQGRDFDNTKFYAWEDGNKVRIGWMKEMPPPDQNRCLGQVLYGVSMVSKTLRGVSSCWEEENETYT